MDEFNQLKKNISRFFRSKKLALVLILLIILITFLGTVIPQEHIYTHRHMEEMKTQSQFVYYMDMMGFTSIYTSWLFFGIMLIFFINTSFCTYDMWRNAIKRLRNDINFKKNTAISRMEFNDRIPMGKTVDETQQAVISCLKKRRYTLKIKGSDIFAQKHRLGVLATPAFHLCILLVLAAIVYGGVGRMEGQMQLVEGQVLSEQHQNYYYVFEGPLFKEQHRNFGIMLERFDPYYVDAEGTYRGAASRIAIIEDGDVAKIDMVHSNHLMVYRGVTLFQNEYGFSPLFLLKNESGAVITGSYVYAQDDGSGRYQTGFPVGDTGLTAQITLYPNTSRGILQGGYDIPHEPQVYLELFNGTQPLFDGVLGINQMVLLGSYGGENVTLGFYDLKYWSIISVVNDKGTPYIFGGFYLSLFSIFAMFFYSPRHIWARLEAQEDGTVLYIGGRSDRFKSSFEDEFNSIITQIKE